MFNNLIKQLYGCTPKTIVYWILNGCLVLVKFNVLIKTIVWFNPKNNCLLNINVYRWNLWTKQIDLKHNCNCVSSNPENLLMKWNSIEMILEPNQIKY